MKLHEIVSQLRVLEEVLREGLILVQNAQKLLNDEPCSPHEIVILALEQELRETLSTDQKIAYAELIDGGNRQCALCGREHAKGMRIVGLKVAPSGNYLVICPDRPTCRARRVGRRRELVEAVKL